MWIKRTVNLHAAGIVLAVRTAVPAIQAIVTQVTATVIKKLINLHIIRRRKLRKIIAEKANE